MSLALPIKKLDALVPWVAIPAFAGVPLAIGRGFPVPAIALGFLIIPTFLYFRRVKETGIFKKLLAGAALVALTELLVASTVGRDSMVLVVTGLAWLGAVCVAVLRVTGRPHGSGSG